MTVKQTLDITHPELATQWHPLLNKNLTPQDITIGSNKQIYWVCEHRHIYQAKPFNRGKGTGCPYCAGQKVLVGFNDLQTTHPKIAKDWDDEQNGTLTPQNVTAGSNKKVGWRCPQGHHWRATINDRTDGRGCPICAGQQVLPGFNDLATTHPELVNQWDFNKNKTFTPQDVTGGSAKRVHWLCEHHHSWESRISERTRGRGCPICAGQKILAGFNDLATLRPDIAKDWDHAKNGDLTPDQFSIGSGKKVHWVCEHGHEREETINTRRKHNGCLVCRKQESKALKQEN